MSSCGNLAYTRVIVFQAATAGVGVPIHPQGRDNICVYLTSHGTTSGGTILIEEADFDPNQGALIYSGTWSVVGTVLASAFTGDQQLAFHVSPNAYSAVRVRISSAITGGGTIDAVLVMQ